MAQSRRCSAFHGTKPDAFSVQNRLCYCLKGNKGRLVYAQKSREIAMHIVKCFDLPADMSLLSSLSTHITQHIAPGSDKQNKFQITYINRSLKEKQQQEKHSRKSKRLKYKHFMILKQ